MERIRRARCVAWAASLLLPLTFGCGGAADSGDSAEAAATAHGKPIVFEPDLADKVFVMALSNDEHGFDTLVYLAPVGEDGTSKVPAAFLALKPGDLILSPPARSMPDTATKAVMDQLSSWISSPAPDTTPPIPSVMRAGERFATEIAPNASGFARRVREKPVRKRSGSPAALEGWDVYYVATDHADLADVIPETPQDVHYEGPIPADDASSIADFSNRELFNKDGVRLFLNTAKVTQTRMVQTTLRMHSRAVEKLAFNLQDELDFTLEATLDGNGAFQQEVRKTLFTSQFALPVQFVGVVPIAETLKLTIDAHCKVSASGDAKATFGAKVKQRFNIGATFEGGQWTNTSSVEAPHFEAAVPTLTAAGTSTLTCDLTPKFALLFYDVIGPYVSVSPSASLFVMTSGTANPTDGSASAKWKLDAGISGELGLMGNSSLPGMGKISTITGLKDVHMPLFEAHTTVAESAR
jgi:hypothetical protein